MMIRKQSKIYTRQDTRSFNDNGVQSNENMDHYTTVQSGKEKCKRRNEIHIKTQILGISSSEEIFNADPENP